MSTRWVGRALGAGVGLWLCCAAPGPAGAQYDAFPITGPGDSALQPFDELMTRFMREHSVPGAALAVTKDRHLVYARGFGFADLDRGREVQPTSRFRIASLSKPLTATAVLALAERGDLDLSAPILDIIGADDTAEHTPPVDPQFAQVTVLQVLRHTAGWDATLSLDPMFQTRQISAKLGLARRIRPLDIMQFMLRRPLDHPPGTTYAYSNFGYSLLGRAIESASGQSYESFVQTAVLGPLAIRNTTLGRSLPEDRQFGEVQYSDTQRRQVEGVVGGTAGKRVPFPYGGFDLEVMDAHGGWIASAVDLVRFAAAFDDPRDCPILGPESIATMFARPPGRAGHDADGTPTATYYGCGWSVRPVGTGSRANHWHTGNLPGTAGLLVRRHDGLTWAVLFNTDSSRKTGAHLADIIDPLVHAAANEVDSWPKHDLFRRYL